MAQANRHNINRQRIHLSDADSCPNKPSQLYMIEMKYESADNGDIFFALKDESELFGFRSAGTPVRNKLKNLVAFLEGNKIVVDLSDIHLVSSSFADEVFGKLFIELGPLNFSTKLEIKNVDPTVKFLIDRAIVQRMTGLRG